MTSKIAIFYKSNEFGRFNIVLNMDCSIYGIFEKKLRTCTKKLKQPY